MKTSSVRAAAPPFDLTVPHRSELAQGSGVYAPHRVTVLTLEAERIDQIIHFRTPSIVKSFGLPPRA